MKVSCQGQTNFVDEEAQEAVMSIAVVKIQITCMPSPLPPSPVQLFQNSLAKSPALSPGEMMSWVIQQMANHLNYLFIHLYTFIH